MAEMLQDKYSSHICQKTRTHHHHHHHRRHIYSPLNNKRNIKIENIGLHGRLPVKPIAYHMLAACVAKNCILFVEISIHFRQGSVGTRIIDVVGTTYLIL